MRFIDRPRLKKLTTAPAITTTISITSLAAPKDAVKSFDKGREAVRKEKWEQARQYFEKAVRLNPRNLDALSDLFEYYLEAPGFLGGGMDKAQQLAGQIAQVDPSEGYWAMFKLAEERRDYSRAEEQLRRAVEAAPRSVGRVIELARFLTKQGRYQEADQSFERAEKIAPNSPRLMYARADLYIKTGRNLDTAKALLERYLNATLTPEDPPRAEAVKLLRKVRGG